MPVSFKEFELHTWENIASAYHENFGAITPKVASVLVDKAEIKPRDKLLDIACGPGYVGACALRKGAVVLGVDFSNKMIQEAKTIYPKINFQVMDAEELQFSDASFDVVLTNFGILHFADPKKAIQEACRVLKPNGEFLFTVWDQPSPFGMVLEAVKEKGTLTLSLPEGPDFFQFANTNTARETLLGTGFHLVETERIEFLWELNSAEEFFRAFYKGGARIGEVLRFQKQDSIKQIIDNLSLRMKTFQKNGKLEVPVPVLMLKARKI